MRLNHKHIKEYVLISFGALLVAISLHFFFFPAKLASGGISGIAIILEELFPAVSKPVYVLILNIIFFGIGFAFLGPVFGIKTIYASFFLTGALEVLLKIFGEVTLTQDMFLNTLYGTLLASLGMVIVFNYGGSTGGTDILAKIINKFLRFDLGKSLLMVDGVITAMGFLVFGPQVGLYSLLSVLVSGNLIDRLIEGMRTAKEIMIISKEHEAIRQYILVDLDRSCTVLKGYGGYTKADTDVIYVVLNRRNYIQLRDYIKEIDPRAFLSVNEVREVLGEGYQEI